MSDETSNRAGTVDLASIDISLEDSKPVERPFLAAVTQDIFEDGRVFGPGDVGAQWHPTVTALRTGAKPMHDFLPLKYASAREDGVVTYFDGHDAAHPVKYSMAGAFGRVLDSYRSTFGAKDDDGNDRKPGHQTFNGLTGWFVQRVLTFGKDPITGELRGANSRPHIIALRKATAQEIAEADSPGSVAAVITGYSPEDVESALAILDGKKPIEYQRGLMKAPISAELKNAILSGDAAKYLVAKGHATEQGGVIVRTAEVVAV